MAAPQAGCLMRSGRLLQTVALFGRILVGAGFLTAAVMKLTEPHPIPPARDGIETFARLLEVQGIVPEQLTLPVAWSVLSSEVVLGFALLWPGGSRFVLWCAAFVLCGFSAYAVTVFIHQGQVQCGCFGRILPDGLATVLARNTILTAALGPALLVGSSRRSPHRQHTGELAEA
ncbi:MAG: hypothetical protein JNM07_03690 [Phycisphaerae bacterium]|nr:hypothetical protein [Phycisphaerae bacterium]